jgi:FkbM family methyltransferase
MTPDDLITRARLDLIAAQKDLIARVQNDKTRRRGPLMRRLHEVRQMLDRGYSYTSQAGQDAVVDQIMRGKRGGTFVDVGGYDGVTGSNTLFLEQWRGWTGVLVEPVPSQLEKARLVRRCPCLGLAVAATDGEAEFLEIAEGYTQMSGLAESYDQALLDQVRADPRHKERTLRVETRTLARILNENGLENPDFISLDIEGGEARALAEFPFERHRVGVWAIENNSAGPEIGQIMAAHGYQLVEFCGPDEIWRFSGLSS